MTKNWNDLPDEMKEIVVDNMDIFTRFRLKMCSKNDKRLVETVPLHCDYMSVRENYDSSVSVHLNTSCVFLISSSGVTIYNKRAFKTRSIVFSTLEEGWEMVKSIFHNVLSKHKVRIGEFFSNMELINVLPTLDVQLHVKQLQLIRSGVYQQQEWVDILAKPPQKLIITRSWNGMGSHAMIKSVKNLIVEGLNDVDDEQLMNLKAMDMYIGESQITGNGINAFVKKMIAEDYPLYSHMIFLHESDFELNALVDGLTYEILGNLSGEDHRVRINMSPTKLIIMTTKLPDPVGKVTLWVVKRRIMKSKPRF